MWWRRQEDEAKEDEAKERSFLGATAASFGVVFLAEWGDLTQLGTAALAARYAQPLVVFGGATAALWCVAGIAVVAGSRAGKLLDPTRTKKVAAVVFAALGVLLIAGVLWSVSTASRRRAFALGLRLTGRRRPGRAHRVLWRILPGCREGPFIGGVMKAKHFLGMGIVTGAFSVALMGAGCGGGATTAGTGGTTATTATTTSTTSVSVTTGAGGGGMGAGGAQSTNTTPATQATSGHGGRHLGQPTGSSRTTRARTGSRSRPPRASGSSSPPTP